MKQMQIISHSHKPYGASQVDIHSCKASSFIATIYSKAFYDFVMEEIIYQMR